MSNGKAVVSGRDVWFPWWAVGVIPGAFAAFYIARMIISARKPAHPLQYRMLFLFPMVLAVGLCFQGDPYPETPWWDLCAVCVVTVYAGLLARSSLGSALLGAMVVLLYSVAAVIRAREPLNDFPEYAVVGFCCELMMIMIAAAVVNACVFATVAAIMRRVRRKRRREETSPEPISK